VLVVWVVGGGGGGAGAHTDLPWRLCGCHKMAVLSATGRGCDVYPTS